MFGWINNKTEERLTIQAQEQLKAFLKRRLDKLSVKEAERILWQLTYSLVLLQEMGIPACRENADIVRAELVAQFRTHFPNWNYATEVSQYEKFEEYKDLRKSLNGDKYAIWEVVKRAENSVNNDKPTREKTVALLRNKNMAKVPTGFKLLGFSNEEEVKFLISYRFDIANFLEKIYADFDSSLDAYRSHQDFEMQHTTQAKCTSQAEADKQEMAIQYPGTPEETQKAAEIKKGYRRSGGLKEYIVQNSNELQQLLELIQKNPELKWLLKHPEEVKQLTERSEEIGFAKYSQPILNDMEEVLQLCILLRRFEPSESS